MFIRQKQASKESYKRCAALNRHICDRARDSAKYF